MADEILPADSVVKVSFEITIPAAASKEDVQDWVNLHMGCGGMSIDNPLSKHEPEAINEPVLMDTEKRLVEKHFPKDGYTEVQRSLKVRN